MQSNENKIISSSIGEDDVDMALNVAPGSAAYYDPESIVEACMDGIIRSVGDAAVDKFARANETNRLFMLSHGSLDPNGMGTSGTPLSCATFSNQPKVVMRLIEMKADVNK